MLFALLYSAASGLMGVALTDAFQFVIAMTGSIILATIVIKSPEIGGIEGLKTQLNQYSEGYLRFFPSVAKSGYYAKSLSIGIWGFIAFIGLQWWASWYPGNEPGGGGYMAQRMMSTKSEKDSILATLLFQIAHYALRPWPWILVGLSAVILYPQLGATEKELGFVMAIKDFMPIGLKGLLLVAMLAAYMSTISTQLNLGASFVVNDIYKRFLYKEKYYTTDESDPEKHFVLIGRIATILLAALGLYATTFFTTIKSVWEFLISCGAGLGLVLILRWFWWRINAWSEITATITPIFMVILFQYILKIPFPISLYPIVGGTTLVWLLVMYNTKPEGSETLITFCDRIRPIGFWTKVGFEYHPPKRYYSALFLGWISAVISVYSILFGIGKLILQEYYHTLGWFIAAVIYLAVLIYALKYINESDY
jgi:Na+/proline symporter